jgi:DNA-binding protein YbaB
MPNIDEIMKMAQEAQNKLIEEQKKLDTIEVEGAAGGGMVKVRAIATESTLPGRARGAGCSRLRSTTA